MKVIQETLLIKEISLDVYFKDFPETLIQYIELFKITKNFNFEIKLKEEFESDFTIQKKIELYLKRKFIPVDNLKIVFNNKMLPF